MFLPFFRGVAVYCGSFSNSHCLFSVCGGCPMLKPQSAICLPKKTYAIVRLNLRHIHFIVTLIRIFSKQKNKKRIRVFICQWAYDQDHSKTSSSSQLEKVPKKWSENRKSIASRGNGLIFMAHPANQDLFLMKWHKQHKTKLLNFSWTNANSGITWMLNFPLRNHQLSIS